MRLALIAFSGWLCASCAANQPLPAPFSAPSPGPLPAVADLPAMNQLSKEQVDAVLTRLSSAQAIARSAAALPFTISCAADDISHGCDPGARAVLAGLDLTKATTVRAVSIGSCIRTLFQYREDSCPAGVDSRNRETDSFLVGFGRVGGGLIWTVGFRPAAGNAVKEMELQHSLVAPGPLPAPGPAPGPAPAPPLPSPPPHTRP